MNILYYTKLKVKLGKLDSKSEQYLILFGDHTQTILATLYGKLDVEINTEAFV